MKPEEALSEAQRKAANDWFDHTLYSRLNDKRHGAIVIIMQRLHEDDLVGHVLEQEPWEVVRFPAIAEAEEVHEIETIWGPRAFRRRPGEALHPDREPVEILERIRRTIGEYNFAGQYQQSPAPLGGGLVKEDWFKRYNEQNRPERFDRIVQSWDTANKATELSDFSVCTTWGSERQGALPARLVPQAARIPGAQARGARAASLFDADVVLIEDKASGTQLIQELIAEGCHAVTRYQPTTTRLCACTRRPRRSRTVSSHPRDRALARRIPARDDGLPKGQARRPGRLDCSVSRLVQTPVPGPGFYELTRMRAEAERPFKPQRREPE